MAELVVKANGGLTALYEKVVKDGAGVEPIRYEGRQVGMMGYASAKDRDVQLKMLSNALEESKDIYEAVNKLNKISQLVENEVVPEETVEVLEHEVILSYKDKKTYIIVPGAEQGENVKVLADLSELGLPNIGKEALKELLIRETQRVMQEHDINEIMDLVDDRGCDYGCDCGCDCDPDGYYY